MLTIYKDINANAIFIEDANGVQFLNSLQASANGDNVTVLDLARDIEIVTETHYNPNTCLLYTSPSPRDRQKSRMPSSA